MLLFFSTSILVSTLIQSTPKNRIKNLKDLSNSKLSIGFDDVIHIRIFLNVSLDFIQFRDSED